MARAARTPTYNSERRNLQVGLRNTSSLVARQGRLPASAGERGLRHVRSARSCPTSVPGPDRSAALWPVCGHCRSQVERILRARARGMDRGSCLTCGAGARRGELCGLRWSDVDLTAKTVTVSIERVQVGWDAVEDEPKSESSTHHPAGRRDSDGTASSNWPTGRPGRKPGPNRARCLSPRTGRGLHPALVTKLCERQAFAVGLPPIRLHDTRHGAATYALAGWAGHQASCKTSCATPPAP